MFGTKLKNFYEAMIRHLLLFITYDDMLSKNIFDLG